MTNKRLSFTGLWITLFCSSVGGLSALFLNKWIAFVILFISAIGIVMMLVGVTKEARKQIKDLDTECID